MPPRFAYWTIILDGTATSFRAHDQAEILPTFNQLKKKDPTAQLKWFSGGKLWDSPEQARELRQLERVRQFREGRKKESHDEREREAQAMAEFRKQHGRPADGSDDPSLRSGGGAPPEAGGPPDRRESRETPSEGPRAESRGRGPGGPRSDRGKSWRPGGDHKDPRDKYKLPPGVARKRWKERHLGQKPFGAPSTRNGQERSLRAGKPGGPPPAFGPPQGRPEPDRGAARDGHEHPPTTGKPFGDRPRGPRPFSPKPSGDRPWTPKPGGSRPFGGKPSGDRPWSPKPGGPRPQGPRPFDRRPPRGPGRKGPR